MTDSRGTWRDVAAYDTVLGTTSIADHLVYDGFGNLTSQTPSAVQPRFTYTGQRFDSLTGLDYDGARWYDAVNGLFISQDPAQFSAGDANLTRYVGNDPVNFTDPTGMSPASDVYMPGGMGIGRERRCASPGGVKSHRAAAGPRRRRRRRTCRRIRRRVRRDGQCPVMEPMLIIAPGGFSGEPGGGVGGVPGGFGDGTGGLPGGGIYGGVAGLPSGFGGGQGGGFGGGVGGVGGGQGIGIGDGFSCPCCAQAYGILRDLRCRGH